MRLQEAETRARIEAQAVIEQQRLAEEMRLREQEIAKKRPTWLIVLAAILVVGVGGLGFFLYQQSEESEKAAKKAAIEKAELEKQIAALQGEIDAQEAEKKAAEAALAEATNENERLAAQARIDASNQKLENLRAKKKRRGSSRSRSSKPKDKTVNVSDDCLKNPLGC
jgi:cell division protein FtsN